MVSGSVDSGCYKLSENIWFVWSKRSYGGEKMGCHLMWTDNGNVKIELEFLKQNSQFMCFGGALYETIRSRSAA